MLMTRRPQPAPADAAQPALKIGQPVMWNDLKCEILGISPTGTLTLQDEEIHRGVSTADVVPVPVADAE
jgi:hypothetical protein